MSKTYTDDQRITALAVLAANGGNITKTAAQTGISRPTLREWQATELNDLPAVATRKEEFTASFLASVRQVREAASTRMLELIPNEMDLHKVAGALKIANEAARLESGEATTRGEVRHVEDDPERTRLARQAAAALEREWETAPGLN